MRLINSSILDKLVSMLRYSFKDPLTQWRHQCERGHGEFPLHQRFLPHPVTFLDFSPTQTHKKFWCHHSANIIENIGLGLCQMTIFFTDVFARRFTLQGKATKSIVYPGLSTFENCLTWETQNMKKKYFNILQFFFASASAKLCIGFNFKKGD